MSLASNNVSLYVLSSILTSRVYIIENEDVKLFIY